MPSFIPARIKRFLQRRRSPDTNHDSAPEHQPQKTLPIGIKPLWSPDDATIDIVFVHGLNGDREGTWSAPGAKEPWPKTLLPSTLPTARVLTFGYDANVATWRGVVSQSFIANHAWNLLTSLSSHREKDNTNDRPVIFVCHSLGGLVCEDALLTSRQRTEPHLYNILHSTRGIMFLGTPHHGAGIATWAVIVSRSIGLLKQTNPEIVDVIKRDSEVLARIQDGFHTMVKANSTAEKGPIEVTCFYEELPVLGVGFIVPQNSAILPGYITIGIHGNHMDMTKFDNAEDPRFMAVSGELRRWVKDTDVNKRHHTSQSPSDQPPTANQKGENARQYNHSGAGTQRNAGGHYFEARGDQNFGMIPSMDSLDKNKA